MSEQPSPPLRPVAPATMSSQQHAQRQQARQYLHDRIGRYKRRIALAALIGFGAVSLLIAHPDLGSAAPTSPTSSQQDPGNFFNQQGGNSNGNGISQQPPATSSNAS